MHFLRSFSRPLASIIAVAAISTTASAQTSGIWTNLAGGSWGLDTNWQTLEIADGVDALADFSTLNLTANATVTLDGARLVGGLKFGDATTASHDWIVDTGTGGPLTLDVSTGAASINVVNRVATINAVIAGADGINVTGAGTLVLNGANTFSGQVNVASGTTLQIGTLGAFGAEGVGNETIVANGGVLRVATVGAAINYGPELIRVGGTGIGNTGAIFGASGATSTLRNITLTDHTSFGGAVRFNISGGTLDLNGFKLTKVGTNQIAVPGGTVTDGDIDITAGNLSFEAGAAVKGTGTITVSSGAILGLWANTAGQQTRQVALNGGAILRELGSNNANSTFSSPIRLQGNVTVDVLNAGTHLKLPGGISESGGAFGFTRTGPGSLTLGGTNSFTGTVNLNTSTTFLAAGATLAASTINVASGAVFDVTPAGGYTLGSGQTLAAGRTGTPANDMIGAITAATGSTIAPGGAAVRTLTFANNFSLDGTTLIYDLGSTTTAGAGVNDLIAVTGDLALSGTNFITPRTSGTPPVEGTYTLLTYTGAIATGDASNFAVSLPPMTRQSMAVDTTTTPNAVLLQVTGAAASLTWVGDDVNNVWNLDGAANFTDGFAPQEFLNLDTVNFADGGSATPAVNVTGTLQPAAVVVNATQDYTFGGTGVLSGTMPLTKSGTGTLTINGTDHDFSGGVTINGGTVSVATINPAGEAGPLGTGPLNLAGGTLEYSGGTGSTSRVLTLGTGGGALRVANTATVLTLTASPTGATPFVKSGPGVLLTNFTGTQTGGTVIAEGTLRLANTNALGAAGSAVTVADGATLDVAGLTPINKVVLTISGSGVDGLGALRNSGVSVVNNNIATTVNLAADATIGTNSRYDFVGAVAVNGGTFTLTKVGTGETWWAPSAGATIGDIVVAGGRLGVQSSNNLGSTSHSIIVAAGAQVSSYNTVTNVKPIILGGGTLHNNSAGGVAGTVATWNGSLTLQGTGITNRIDSFGGPIVLNGKITGPGGFEKLSSGGTAYDLDLSSAENDYLGDTHITRGTVRIVGAGVISPNSSLVMNGAGATFDGAGTAQTVAGLRGTAGVVTNVALTVNNTGSDVFSGDLTGANTSLVKTGTGTLTLASAGNTYSGATTVNDGTLLVTGTVTGSAATVNGGILGGTGTTGALTLNDGSIAPGVAGIGTLNAASLLWNGGELQFELGAANSSDRLSLSAGVFDKGASTSFVFDFLGTGAPDSIYTLADFGSTDFLVSDFSFINLALGDGGGTFQMDGSTLQFVTVPEPGSAVVLLAGLSTLLGTRRRREQSLRA